MFGSPVTKEYLQGLAQAATVDFLSHGTPLTEAVIKQASACGANLTAEHVRRICEMTYHDTYERMHRQEGTSADRYIVFDPPDAEVAAEVLRAEKVASAPKRTSSFAGGLMTEKTASAEVARAPKFKPANAFDQIIKQADTDHSAPFAQAQGLHDLKRVHDALKEASASLRAEMASAEGEILHARRELSKVAYATVKDGASVEDVLHACFSGMDWDAASQETATKVASDLSAYLLTKEARTAGLHLSKTASYGDVNPEHPLPAAFTKVAAVEERHIHLEIALGEVENDLEHANRALTEALFGEKNAARFSPSAVKSIVNFAKKNPLTTAAMAGGALIGGGIAAGAAGLDPRNAPGGSSNARKRSR